MSASEIADRIVKEVMAEKYDFIVLNFANPDMVGHTGNFKATLEALEATDKEVGKIADAVLLKCGAMFITADHGNAEELKNLQTGKMDKEHSTNPVPVIVVGKEWEGQVRPELEGVAWDLSLVPPVGSLADVAPTILKMLGVKKPDDMTGVSLL